MIISIFILYFLISIATFKIIVPNLEDKVERNKDKSLDIKPVFVLEDLTKRNSNYYTKEESLRKSIFYDIRKLNQHQIN